jgi:hypothetical protein
MLSLMFSLCIAGQPCKEERVADFYTDMATTMCDTNKKSMTNSLGELPKEAATHSKFECKELAGVLAKQFPVSELVFDVTTNGAVEKMELAKFYGRVADPLCGQNRDYYEDVLLDSARQQKSTGVLYCQTPVEEKVAGS